MICTPAEQSGKFTEDCPEKGASSDNVCHMDKKHITKNYSCTLPYEYDQAEEEVIAAICHSGKYYSSTQLNTGDDKYFKQINQ